MTYFARNLLCTVVRILSQYDYNLSRSIMFSNNIYALLLSMDL